MQVKVTRYKQDITYEDAKGTIFSDTDFLKEFNSILDKRNIKRKNALLLCAKYLKEIAARYTQSKLFWSLSEAVVRRKIIGRFKKIYYEKCNIAAIKHLASDKIVIIAPNHRSVFDFIILSYILVKETTCMPIILAADIFNTFPLGYIFRHFGAYFVRRNEYDELYSLVFKHYVMLISKFQLIHMFFIEGGRNKTGGYSMPKKGILKYIFNGAEKYSKNKDVVFIPVSISYDYVPESNVIVEENKSGKRKHIFRSVVNYLSTRNLGNCYINFGGPISVFSFKRSISHNKLIDAFGDYIMERIKSLATISPTSLICYALLGSDKMEYPEFKKKFTTHYLKLKKSGIDISKINLNKINDYIAFADSKGVIEFDKFAGIIRIDGGKKDLVEYYSNNIIHLLNNIK